MTTIAIDLGATNSVVAVPGVWKGHRFSTPKGAPNASIVLDESRCATTPSVVAEVQGGRVLVGSPAKALINTDAKVIAFAKRHMGENGRPEFTPAGEATPKEVAAHLLRHLKESAEDALGEPVQDAVITVPAYFDLRSKHMMFAAAAYAGLNVRQLIPEPVAAALSYTQGDQRERRTMMIYDLGGQSFDATIVRKEDEQISVVGVDGDPWLSGSNFDSTLTDWMLQKLEETGQISHFDRSDPKNKPALTEMMAIAERAKVALSQSESHEIRQPISEIVGSEGCPVSIDLEISRAEFEELISDEVDRTVQICQNLIAANNDRISADEIDAVAMVGGSSNIPLVRRRIHEALGMEPRLQNPDTCVAVGACLVAASEENANGTAADEACAYLCRNVLSAPINLRMTNGMKELIPAQSALPASTTMVMKKGDTSNRVVIPILEGERLLGDFIIDELPTDLPIGSTIEIELTVREDFTIESSMFLPGIGRKNKVLFQISNPQVPSLAWDPSTPPRTDFDRKKTGSPTMPRSATDLVHFSVTSPPVVVPEQAYLMDVWAHLREQRKEVIALAREEAGGGEIRIKSPRPAEGRS